MNNKQLQPIAMFMICLIITLPIYVSSVYADINNVRAHGKAGVENFITQQYDLTIEADVTGNPTEDKMKLTHSSGLATHFDSCSSTGNDSSLCSVNLVYGVNSAVELCPSSTFNIEQYNGIIIDSKRISIKCDAKPPIITLSVSPQSTTGEDITLSYNIQDPRDATTECSGIDKIEFYLNSLSSGASTIETNSSLCSYSRSLPITTSSYNDGEVIIFVKAYDKLGQSSVANTSFIVDKTGPEAEASVTLTDLYGTTIQYFKPQTVLANVVLTITDLTGVSTYDLDYSQLTSSTPNCRRSGTNLVCEWRGIQLNMNEASFTRTIKLDATDTHGNTASRDVLVQAVLPQDTIPPTIVMSDIIIDTIDGSTVEWFKPGAMKMSFTAEISDDLAGVDTISADFSGMDIITGETPVCTGNPQHYVCTWSNVRFNMNTASFSQEIKVIAKDMAGNEKTEAKTASANYRADNVPPSISNFEIVKSTGAEITDWIGDEQIPAKIYIDITEKGSGLNSVKGLFNDINPSYVRPIEGTCTQTSSPRRQSSVDEEELPEYEYRCVWNVNLYFDTSGNPLTVQFKFNATDNSLNPSIHTFTKDFQVDIDGPIVNSLTLPPSRLDDGDYYVGKDNNKFIARITDSGIGLDKSKVYLDLTNLGISGPKQADNCSGDYCYWDIPQTIYVSEGPYEISISTRTTDSIGNNIEDEFELDIILDTTPPVVDHVEITAVDGALTPAFRDYIQIGNALSIIANVTESNSLFTASGDFSKFISDETEDLADNCERQTNNQGRETDKWICTWATDEIDITRYKKDDIILSFIDIAGNTEVSRHEIEVLEQIEEEVDYWENSVEFGSPNAIDKQIVTLYQPSMWFPVELKPKQSNSNVWPIDIFVSSCSSDETDSAGTLTANYLSAGYGQLPVLVNHNPTEPTYQKYYIYLNYVLEKTSPPDNSIDIKCQLKIKTLVDEKRISPYEYENITVTINYYNNPLGEVSSNIQEEIDRIKGGWLVSQKWMSTVNNLINWAKSLCRVHTVLYKVIVAWSIITTDLSIACVVDPTGTSCTLQESAADQKKIMQDLSKKEYIEIGKKACAFVGCSLWNQDWIDGEGLLSKWAARQAKVAKVVGDKNNQKRMKIWNIEQSLILSASALCVPGVSYNLQKARTIDCQYINCLKSSRESFSLQRCVKERDYGWCKFVWGQIFAFVPFNHLLSVIGSNIRRVLSRPAEVIGFLFGLPCFTTCKKPGAGSLCYLCTVAEMASWTYDVLCDLGIGPNCEPIWDELTVEDSVCEMALEEEEE